MIVENFYEELSNLESSELYNRYISDEYVDEYRLMCLKILNERDDFSKEENFRKSEICSKDIYYKGYGFLASWKMLFKKCVDFDGRSCRSEFWYANLIQCILLFICMLLSDFAIIILPSIIGFYLFISIIPMVALMIRRLHDVGKSGLFLLLIYIPFGIIYLVILFCMDSEKNKNKYGENPKKREKRKENCSSSEASFNYDKKYVNNEITSADKPIDHDKSYGSEQCFSFCRKCGTELSNDSKFCHKCGCEKVY